MARGGFVRVALGAHSNTGGVMRWSHSGPVKFRKGFMPCCITGSISTGYVVLKSQWPYKIPKRLHAMLHFVS
jgi:hypothetical protein